MLKSLLIIELEGNILKVKEIKISKKMVAAYFKVTSKESEIRTGFLSKDTSRPLYQLPTITAKQDRPYSHTCNVTMR